MNDQKPSMHGLLIDLDGTLYHGTSPINGADTLIAYLKETSIPFRFVTNNSSSSPEEVAERLRRMGIPALADDVCTSAQAAAKYIANTHPGAKVFVVGESGLISAVQEAGLVVTEDQPDIVLQGIDRSFTYERVARAVQYIRSGATFILTNPDLLLPSENGFIPGAGSIGAMLQAASGSTPVLIGKPSSILMEYALDSIGLTADETWVIGDNLATDIAFGSNAGCGTLLVLTGITNHENIDFYMEQSGCKPDMICNTLAEVRFYISNHWEQ